ncbi:MAG: hypothetical protein OEZ48_07635 [Candidatus Bathyarchaeota archaeon]|nr:hypothetical protein [Candidatus Bathyarchaeota archaeon]MDH5687715.1 hypothetical protein [Candidatus Bathyarchaeota archaeon]
MSTSSACLCEAGTTLLAVDLLDPAMFRISREDLLGNESCMFRVIRVINSLPNVE